MVEVMKEVIHNRKELKDKRKYLRNNMAEAEARLWNLLKIKDRQEENFKDRIVQANTNWIFIAPKNKYASNWM